MTVDIEPEATTTIAFDESTDADFINKLITHFTASTGWAVNNSQAGTGLTIERAAPETPTFQINIRIVTTTIMISLDPATSITNAENLTGASANISPEVEFVQATSIAGWLIVNEFTDYVAIYQRTDSVIPPVITQALEVGIGMSPAYGSDPGNGMTGHMIAVGTATYGAGATKDMYGSGTSTTSYVRTATAVWQRVELMEGQSPGGGDIDSQDIGGRTVPIPVVMELNEVVASTGRPIGFHKYLFGLGGSPRQPCQVIDDAANSKQLMTLGSNVAASFKICTGIKDGFDPTA